MSQLDKPSHIRYLPCTIDYQGFASSNPQKLAKAIEKGIPDTLRGMMWQLMYGAS